MENKEKLEEIQKKEGKRNLLTNILKETTKMNGEFKINALIIEDEKLENILSECADALTIFNKKMNEYLSEF